MQSDFVKQAELEWKFQRSRDRFNTIRKHFHKLLPQLTGFTSPQMRASVERFFELRIKGPLCDSRAEMLESFEALQALKQRRQTAKSLAVAQDATRIYEAERNATAGTAKGTQQAMLFGPGAPTSESAGWRSRPVVDEDAAVVPGTDPLLYGTDEEDWEQAADEDDAGDLADTLDFEDEEDADDLDDADFEDGDEALYVEELSDTEAEEFEQADDGAEPFDGVPLRRRTLWHILDDLLTMQREAQSVRGGQDAEDGIEEQAGDFAGAASDGFMESDWESRFATPSEAAPGGKDEAAGCGVVEPERASVEHVESAQEPGLAERLFAALAAVLTATPMEGRIVKVTPKLPTGSSDAAVAD